MKLKRVVAWGLALTMTLCLDVPGVNAASGGTESSAKAATKAEQMDMVQNQKKLPGTNRTFFDDDSDIREWFNISGFAAEGVQDRSEYYDEYVANGKKNTKNYVVVEEDGYWKNGTKDYITEEAYAALSETEKAEYRFVTAEEQFTTAFNTKPRVIQVNAEELELGFHYLEDNNIPTGPIEMTSDYDSGSKQNPPITNPVIMHKDDKYGVLGADSDIKGTGVSDLSLYSHLTIFSTTGCMLRHVGLDLSEQEDIIIRNFQFEGMYEWDERTFGGLNLASRKRFGWCYVSGSHSNNIWIDHCTFGYAFDGNVDLSNGCSFSITWCKFGVQNILDGKDENTHETPVTVTKKADGTAEYGGTRWNESQGSELWKNILYMEEIYQAKKAGLTEVVYPEYTGYRDKGATPQELLRYVAMHSKVHLVGSGEKSFYTNVDEKITLGFNYYESIIQRVPMIRQGNGHMYNCIVDDTDFVANVTALRNKGVNVGYTSGGCINARDGASIGADTCIFRSVRPINGGSEFQGPDNINAKEWQEIFSHVRNNQLVVNSSVQDFGDSQPYIGSSWDNDGVNKFIPSFEYKDKSSIGDFHWSKWANQDKFATWQSSLGRYDGVESLLFSWAKTAGWDAYAKQYYLGSDDLGYDYKCFDLDKMEEKVMTYGGAQADLYGADGTELDYIQPYNKKTAEETYGKKVVINTDGGELIGDLAEKQNNVYYIEKGKSITLPTASQISKSGYDFVGWKKASYDKTTGELVLGDLLGAPDEPITISASDTYKEEMYYAVWDVKSYKVTFDSMGGSAVDVVRKVETGQTLKAAGGYPDAPTKDGATFVGWYKYTPETKKYGAKVLESARITEDTILYAKWNNTIAFNTDGAGEIADKKVESGKTVGKVTDPEKDGFTFVGWFTDAEFTNAFDVQTDIVMEPMTLYAKFRSNAQTTATISFNTGYDDVTMAAIEVNIGDTGSAVTEASIPAIADDTVEFGGWYTDRDCTKPFDPQAEVIDDMVLYAKWVKKTVTISFDTGEGNATMAAIEVEVGTTGSAVVALDPPTAADPDTEFKGWYTDQDCTAPFDPEEAITENIILYAKWEKVQKILYGDVDGDKEVTTDDALIVLKDAVSGHTVITEDDKKIAADVDGSGEIDTDDALLILKAAVSGTEIPAPEKTPTEEVAVAFARTIQVNPILLPKKESSMRR